MAYKKKCDCCDGTGFHKWKEVGETVSCGMCNERGWYWIQYVKKPKKVKS